MQKLVVDEDDIVHLNVGGVKDMSVRRSTLTLAKGSSLEVLFSGKYANLHDKVFIDRSP